MKSHLSTQHIARSLAMAYLSFGFSFCLSSIASSAMAAPLDSDPSKSHQTDTESSSKVQTNNLRSTVVKNELVTNEIIKALAPTGVLRASINVGNPVLANLDSHEKPIGISIDLANELGKRLGVPVELIVNKSAGKSVETMESGRADVGFFAVDPERGKEIAFTSPYVLIEGFYLVRSDSPITNNEQVDTVGKKVVVGKGSAYDLFLTRHLKQAEIIRAASSQAVVPDFLSQNIEIAAGVKQQLEMDSKGVTGVRLLPERFMVIRQAMGVPKDRGAQAAHFLRQFVEDMKARGAIQASMIAHGIEGAGVAPAADPALDPLNEQ